MLSTAQINIPGPQRIPIFIQTENHDIGLPRFLHTSTHGNDLSFGFIHMHTANGIVVPRLRFRGFRPFNDTCIRNFGNERYVF